MKKIAIITEFVALPNEKGYSRFEYLSRYLSKEGYHVELITSKFQHWEKKHRNYTDSEIKKIEIEQGYKIKLIDEPGYKKNVDFRRIFSHRRFGKNLRSYLINRETQHDVIYCVIPDNYTASLVAEYGDKYKIPVIIDIEDLWPEAMQMVVDIPVISKILFYPLSRYAEKTYSKASGIIGTSDEYTNRAFINRDKNIPNATVYVGNEIELFDRGVLDKSNFIDKKHDEFWVTYAGTIGASYDIKTLIDSAQLLSTEGIINIKFKILGLGPNKNELEKYSRKNTKNVEFLGYQEYKMMAAYLNKSDILVNSFVRKAKQSMVTKIGDYLAAGKPMINTLSSIEFREKVEKNGFGVNIVAEEAEILAETIKYLYNNVKLSKKMGQQARKIAEAEFDRKKSYGEIKKMINNLC